MHSLGLKMVIEFDKNKDVIFPIMKPMPNNTKMREDKDEIY